MLILTAAGLQIRLNGKMAVLLRFVGAEHGYFLVEHFDNLL